MGLSQEQIRGGITFGDWMLVPLDSRNWELCHRHVAKAVGRHKGGAEPEWHRLGRYYQCNTIGAAIQYAADCELRDKCRESAMELWDALRVYDGIVGALRADMAESARTGA